MIKILKSHVCLCALTTSVFFFMPNISVYAQDSKPSCSSLLNPYKCSELEKMENTDSSRPDVADITVIKGFLKETIKIGEKGLNINGTLQLKKAGLITSEVFSQKKTKIILESSSITGSGKNTGNGKKISGRNNGINHTVFGVNQGGALLVKDSTVNVNNVYGLVAESAPAFSPLERRIEGPLKGMSDIVFENSDITLNGYGIRGLYFLGGLSEGKYIEGEALLGLGEVLFKKSSFKVPNGTAIYLDDIRRPSYITAIKNSNVFADRLLEVKNHSYVSVLADASFFVGGARVDKDSYAELNLFNKSKWTLALGKNNKWHASSVSFVRNIDSSIFFQKPKNGRYQTLHIGADDLVSDYAYVAGGEARLYVNAYLTAYNRTKELKADQLVIYGDVYGSTKVYVIGVPSDPEMKANSRKVHKNNDSISLVQVYGKAQQDSFKLATGYVALRGAPYRYRLKAYTSVLNNADKGKRLAAGSKASNEFWDFRLEREYIKFSSKNITSKSKKVVSHIRHPRSADAGLGYNGILSNNDFHALDEMNVSAVVPQVSTYLLLPNVLFHSSLIDISNQNKQLEESRAAVGGFLENSENPAFFVRSYGGNSRYVSDLSDLEYGYGGDLGYHAVEAGVSLKAMKSADYSTSFGIMGTYGKISLQPQDVVESKKSAFDKWLVTAYGSIQHDTGFYLNGLFSYGLFKGGVLTLVRGKTAELKGNALSASLSVGKSFMTGYEGLVFDPQVQVVYQNLQFDKASDIDGFDIEMGKPNQWVMRVGGRLSKALAVSQTGSVVSFNGKLHFTHRFGEKQFVHFGDKFQLGAFGASLEAGLGFNAQLSSKFALLGDVTYQHKLSKAGFSGARFSGGLRYHF
ncbi:autotransporter outer membrane beta-barrel domain-containing protein [Bartonella sp. ML69XJBT]|uniref:autotransporter outer membrane beta-barrel domain-containing protein n=1 Tax=Bartonella sp. ML69XJBT TaxID=3019092 RepID=UPI00235F6626|nr:autotransporter outer membrane beta-barrel domain-containing protein [Bartonella sp. ML69XJBT]